MREGKAYVVEDSRQTLAWAERWNPTGTQYSLRDGTPLLKSDRFVAAMAVHQVRRERGGRWKWNSCGW
jgi:hypothetical protein